MAFEVSSSTEHTMKELTSGSFDPEEGSLPFFSRADGRLLGHLQHDEALSPDFRQRYEIINNEQVRKMTEDEAREKARMDLELYLEIL